VLTRTRDVEREEAVEFFRGRMRWGEWE